MGEIQLAEAVAAWMVGINAWAERNLSHLRRLQNVCTEYQCLRTGLRSVAPPALCSGKRHGPLASERRQCFRNSAMRWLDWAKVENISL
jgi:hypothetical protein